MSKKKHVIETTLEEDGQQVVLGLEDIKGMTLAQYAEMSKTFSNVENHCYYDTYIMKAGSAITAADSKRLFTAGIGDDGNYPGGFSPTKSELHTNMVEGGEFDNSTTVIVECISVDIFLAADVADDAVEDQIKVPDVNAAVTDYSPALHFQAIRNQFKLEYYRSDQKMMSGLLYEFPSPFVASGAFGGSVGGFIQNGWATQTWNKLHSPDVFESNDRFHFNIVPLGSTFTPQVDVQVRVSLIGKRIRTLYR